MKKTLNNDDFLMKLFRAYEESYEGMIGKELKKKRVADFKEEWLTILQCKFHIKECGYKYVFHRHDCGKFDYYPGADKIMYHGTSIWQEKAFKHIISVLYNQGNK